MPNVIWSKNLSRKNMIVRLKVVEIGPQTLRNLEIEHQLDNRLIKEAYRTVNPIGFIYIIPN